MWHKQQTIEDYDSHSGIFNRIFTTLVPKTPKLGVGLLVVMIWLEFCPSYSSICHHQLHHPLLQQIPEWKHSGTG